MLSWPLWGISWGHVSQIAKLFTKQLNVTTKVMLWGCCWGESHMQHFWNGCINCWKPRKVCENHSSNLDHQFKALQTSEMLIFGWSYAESRENARDNNKTPDFNLNNICKQILLQIAEFRSKKLDIIIWKQVFRTLTLIMGDLTQMALTRTVLPWGPHPSFFYFHSHDKVSSTLVYVATGGQTQQLGKNWNRCTYIHT